MIARNTKRAAKTSFFVAMLLSILFSGAADPNLVLIRTLSIILHLPILVVEMPSNVMMVVSELIPYTMFDYVENPYDINIQTLITIDTSTDSEVPGQVESLGYDSSNYVLNLQTVLFGQFAYLCRVIYTLVYYKKGQDEDKKCH